MHERLRQILIELEDINALVQQGCIDVTALECFGDVNPEDAMLKTDELITDAYCSIETLMTMMEK